MWCGFPSQGTFVAPARPVASIPRAPGPAGGTRTPVVLIPNEVAWPLAHSWLTSPGRCGLRGRLPGNLPRASSPAHGRRRREVPPRPSVTGEKCDKCPVVIVRTGIREYRKKHRWKESNPRDTGLESGPQPLRTDVVSVDIQKRAACCRLPGSDGSWEDLPLGDHPGGPPALGLSSMPSWWWKASSYTGRRHADKALGQGRQAFLGFRMPRTISPRCRSPCGK
jgi:hypothetical protein